MKTYEIPYNKPFIAGKELYNISLAVIENAHLSGNGPFTKKCRKWIEEKFGCRKVLLTHSCTAALEMSAILADISPGDEVIMPSFTFVSTANAFVLRGGVPVFIDIRPDNLNMDERLIEAAVTNRTKAVVPVHYAGFPCEMNTIMEIARKNDLLVIEDAAQGFLSRYETQYLGSIGHLGCLSFHETKNIISGEGGALLINDDRFLERAEIIWEKGTNRHQFFRGEVDKYTWVDIGSSFLPGELVSAFLYAQIEVSEKIIEKRRKIFDRYMEGLAPLQESGRIRLPVIETGRTANGHIFYIITASENERTDLIAALKAKGILAVFHYIPLHDSPAGKKFGRVSGKMNMTEDLSKRLLRLPIYYELTETEIDRVISVIHDFYS